MQDSNYIQNEDGNEGNLGKKPHNASQCAMNSVINRLFFVITMALQSLVHCQISWLSHAKDETRVTPPPTPPEKTHCHSYKEKKKHTNRCELVGMRAGNQRGWEGIRNEAERRRNRLETEERWSKTKAWQQEIRGRQSHDADVRRLLRCEMGGLEWKPADSAVGNQRARADNRYGSRPQRENGGE